jgi:hypothetical protein
MMNYFFENMKKIVMILFVGLLASAGLQAQKVYKDASNRVILDLTEGMPAGAITAVSKTTQYDNLTPTNSGGTLPNNLHNSPNNDPVINTAVFQKLEIAPHDVNGVVDERGTIGINSTYTTNWATAFKACIKSTHDSGNWRLPTQRELMLIWIFKPALEDIFSDEDINGSAFDTSYYWSATEYPGGANSWSVNFSNGAMYNNPKENLYRVRCVREVTN